MAKALLVHQEKCDGCRLCEKACANWHAGVEDPDRSRIRIDEWDGVFVPVVCQQCEDAPCIAACPTSSRTRDEATGKTAVDYDRCIGCKTCIAVCPFGASRYDKVSRQVVTCDLCDGDPQCVKVCERGALSYVDKRDLHADRQFEAAERLSGVLARNGQSRSPAATGALRR